MHARLQRLDRLRFKHSCIWRTEAKSAEFQEIQDSRKRQAIPEPDFYYTAIVSSDVRACDVGARAYAQAYTRPKRDAYGLFTLFLARECSRDF